MKWFSSSIALMLAPFAFANEPTKEQADFFEKQIRPILTANCYSCHSDAKKAMKGGLVLDSRTGMLDGGSNGPAIVPGEPGKSLLIEAINHAGDTKMPKEKMPQKEIDALTAWVKMGAPWPNSGTKATRKHGEKFTDEDRKWWAIQPVKAVEVPAAGTWGTNEIDRFINVKLKELKLSPAPEANRIALIRRLTFDLNGLPPTPQEIQDFVNDASPNAYEKLVDRLLASPRYGERWARQWLDLVRYADSDGYRLDEYRPNSWRYRDYVIKSFNTDKPYDRFVKEQLAGDELYPNDKDALIATGYMRHWIYEYNQRDPRNQWNIILDDITDTTADVFLGIGLQCAKCHDHKFDPLLQKDYFRLRAFFAGLLPKDQVAATDQEKAEYQAKLKVWQEKTAEIRGELATMEAGPRAKAEKNAIEKFPADIQVMMRKLPKDRTVEEHQIAELAYRQVYYEFDRIERVFKGPEKEKYIALKKQLATFDNLKPAALPVAFGATDYSAHAAPMLIPKKKGDPVEPGFISLINEQPAKITPNETTTGRRSALAEWIADAKNPLTARVIVNRIWQHHFGRGLAANASDFGRLGEAPSHPELLDWMADQFVKDGWSMKSVHRRIVMSATYRQSASHSDPNPGRLRDPLNVSLWRGGVRRLDAEQIRDALFAVTGELDLTSGGPGATGGDPRRSVYSRIMRNTRDPLLDVFDAPQWFSSVASRDTTTTPVQSLLLINSSYMLARGRAFADRLAKTEPDETKRLTLAYELAFGRKPTSEEVAIAQKFLETQAKNIDPKKSSSAAAAFNPGKIPYREGQAALMKLEDTSHYIVPHSDKLPTGSFTVEAYIFPKSVADTGAVRTVLSKWSGSATQEGWSFGITGKQSRRKPQTLVMQMFGKKQDGKIGEDAVFSDQHIALNKPYYIAAVVQLATEKEKGSVTFHVKDLSNDDEQLLTAKVEHSITEWSKNTTPMAFGGRPESKAGGFDGLIDDVRLSEGTLTVDQLLFTREGINKQTVGYWQFEIKPNVFRDGSGHGLDIQPGKATTTTTRDVRKAAWIDLCQILLNSSEFLYVE